MKKVADPKTESLSIKKEASAQKFFVVLAKFLSALQITTSYSSGRYPTTYPNTRFFYKQCFFSAQPQCCLTFSRIELQMLLRCYLLYITVIMLRYILYLVYLCPYLGLGLFMSYICDLFFIFSLVFVVINHITSLKQTPLSFVHFSEYLLLFLDDNMDEKSEYFANSECSASGGCLAFA